MKVADEDILTLVLEKVDEVETKAIFIIDRAFSQPWDSRWAQENKANRLSLAAARL